MIVDTAGRLHTQGHLMDELRKIHRVIGQRIAGAPHEVLLTIDATTGQNGLQQARLFAEAVAVTGIVLTKLDGTAKGGIVLAIAHELGIPVKLVGVGEGIEDLRPFDPTTSPARSSRNAGNPGFAPRAPSVTGGAMFAALRRRTRSSPEPSPIGAVPRHAVTRRCRARRGFALRIPRPSTLRLMFDSLVRPARRHARRPARPGAPERGRHQPGDARDPARAARGRRELRRRQGVRRGGEGAGAGRRRDAEPDPRPAGDQDRPRGADVAHGRRPDRGSRSRAGRRP